MRHSDWHSGNANEMNPASDENTSSTARPHEQDLMVDTSHELDGTNNDCKGHFIRLWKAPVPVRRGRIIADFFKSFAILVTAVCIAQTLYIYYLRSGLVRIPNDPFDNIFWGAEWHSPSVWRKDRQEFLHNAQPLPVHSHNDYWRSIPLHEALASGCISIEADVHLRNNDLYIGHARPNGKSQTLRSMYLEPLQRMLSAQNPSPSTTGHPWRGIFNASPQQTTILLLDIKSAGASTLATLTTQLEPLRHANHLTHWNGTHRVTRALTIVISGNVGLENDLPYAHFMTVNATHRDIFLDAPLANLLSLEDDYAASPPTYFFNASNSYYASTRFRNARLYPRHWRNGTAADGSDWEEQAESSIEREVAASQLQQARERGLVSRYWGTPDKPPNLREIVWRKLVELEVGVLNMDDLGAVRARTKGWGRL